MDICTSTWQTLPVDRCVRAVVVQELSPLHQHERVPDVGRTDVVVDVDGHQPRARKWRSENWPAPGAHQAVVVSWSLSKNTIVNYLEKFLSFALQMFFPLTSSLVNARIDFPYSGKFKLLHHPVKVLKQRKKSQFKGLVFVFECIKSDTMEYVTLSDIVLYRTFNT